MTRITTIKTIYTAPVKSLALQQPARVYVGFRGIAGDRRFYLVNQQGKLLTQRQLGKLVQVKAEYSTNRSTTYSGGSGPAAPSTGPESLRLTFPNGETCQGPVKRGRAIGTRIWDRRVKGHLIEGAWNEALSEFCGEPVRVVASDDAGEAFDEFPISILSAASLRRLTGEAGGAAALPGPFTGDRFRPSLLMEGCQPHEEDAWLGGVIQVGHDLRLQPVTPDPRCSIVTLDPATGRRDVDTLGLIRSYRPGPVSSCFGVYALVQNPGPVSVGDEVKVLTSRAGQERSQGARTVPPEPGPFIT